VRIIAGDWRGTRLYAPRGRDIRPTADRLRESIFNILGSQIPGQHVLDLFAGTGAMGIEALSRGAAHATLIDSSLTALALIRRNIAKVKAEEKTTVIRWNIAHSLRCLEPGARFDVVFVDPPYGKGLLSDTLASLSAFEGHFGRLIVEHDVREPIHPLPACFRSYEQRRYGKTLVSFLMAVV
jgi:16S rRNA (guanine(966)-N(2))-methyltransferase RsmD